MLKPEVYGESLTTFIFGMAITIVCPLMSMFQIFSFGLFSNLMTLKNGNLCRVLGHILKVMKHQLVIIIDSSVLKFENLQNEKVK